MGRNGSGVEIRPQSIRIAFTFEGVPRRETVRTNGEPIPPTPANVKWATRLAAEIRQKIKHGTFVYADYFPHSSHATTGQPTTVADQLETWLASQRLKTSTRVGYGTAVRFWTAEIGSVPLKALKHSDVLMALARHPKLAGKTINNRVSVLQSALKLAVLDKMIQANPLDGLPRAKQQKPPVEPFTPEESARIVEGAAKHYPGQIANMVAFWFRTGLRTSELFGLKWSNVAAGHVVIREARVAGVEEDSTKTSRAREVRLDAIAQAALTAQKAHTFLAGSHVFCDPYTGKPWANTQAFSRRCWAPLLKRLGIPHRRPYNIRHTRATEMLMAGVNPAFGAKQLGHDLNVYLTTYAKWLPGGQDEVEMAKLERPSDGALGVTV